MRIAAIAALALVGSLAAAPAVADGSTVPRSLAGFAPIAHGTRRGVLLAGPVRGVGAATVYLPVEAGQGRALRVVYIDVSKGSPAAYATDVHLAATGDQLIWDGTTPPFVAVVAHVPSARARTALESWSTRALAISRAPGGRTLLRVPSPMHASLEGRITRALQSPAARRSSAAARAVAPAGFSLLFSGPDGGTLWSGRIPGRAVPDERRQALVYLPPDARRTRRYPLVVLLHGLRGSPYSFAGGLRIAAVADPLVRAQRVRPFIAVMPPAGLTPSFDGEWTGAWERYVIDDVIPWADARLPVERAAASRMIAGFSAGGYGAIDMALRHPGTFGVAESWSGYFDAPHDGSLRDATPIERHEHSPSWLVAHDLAGIAREGLRMLLSAGVGEPVVLHATRAFAAELARDHLPSRLLVMPGRHDGAQWHAVLGPGLRYALAPSASVR
jgi:enterochelin esterase-like enzyme